MHTLTLKPFSFSPPWISFHFLLVKVHESVFLLRRTRSTVFFKRVLWCVFSWSWDNEGEDTCFLQGLRPLQSHHQPTTRLRARGCFLNARGVTVGAADCHWTLSPSVIPASWSLMSFGLFYLLSALGQQTLEVWRDFPRFCFRINK